MATWDVEDLVKEISDMEAIYQRNAGSQLVPRMQEALQSKVNGVQMLAASNFLKRPDAVQNGILTADTKAELQAFLESRAASSIQGATRLQATPQSMTTPWNYLSQSEWQQMQNGIDTVDATHMLIKRIKVCGLKSLKEDTKKYLTSFLVSLQVKSPMSCLQFLTCTNFVLDTFEAVVAQPLHAGLARYPPSPHDIGEALGL